MRINAIQAPAFKGVYVTTSTKNNGDYVEKEVIKPFKKNFQPAIEKDQNAETLIMLKKALISMF